MISLTLAPKPPFRLDLTAWALRRRPENAVDVWDGRYRRAFDVPGGPVLAEVWQRGSAERPRLRVELSSGASSSAVRAQLELMLGLRIELANFYTISRHERRLGVLAERFRGVKPPRFPSVFEALLNGVACQQLSLHVGLVLLNRLAARFGARAGGQPAFPTPARLAEASADAIKALGFSGAKARAIVGLARAIEEGRFLPDRLDELSDESARDALLELPGVGRWTAEYVLLRGLRRLDVFPGDDVGARKSLARFFGRDEPFDYAGVRRAVEPWQPYAGFAYFHLLLERVRQAGWLGEPPSVERAAPPEIP